MAAIHPSINDQITRVQLRLLKQKLENEQERLKTTAEQDKDSMIMDKYNRLEEAVSRRQELLDKLQQERLLNEELSRPSSFPGLPQQHRKRGPSHQQLRYVDRRSESQPQFADASARPIIEHRYMAPTSSRLDPLEKTAPVHQLLPTAIPPIVQQPYLVAPPAAVQSYDPQSGNNNRTDMYEMMMIQNAQMHQMIMQQLMMSAVPRPPLSGASPQQNDTRLSIDLKELLNLKKSLNNDQNRPSSVHYYHYGPPQQPETQPSPAGAYPYTLPPIQVLPAAAPYVTADTAALHSEHAEYPSHLHRHYERQHQHDGNAVQ